MEGQETKGSIGEVSVCATQDVVDEIKTASVYGGASFFSSSANLINTIIGAGVLAMPFALSNTGLFGGILVILLSGTTGALGLYYLALSAFKLERGKASFNTMSAITIPAAAVIFDFSIAINCFGACLSYLILIGDVMPQVVRMAGSSLPDSSLWLNRRTWITIYTFILIPFVFLRRLNSLRFISFLSVGAIGYMSIIVIVFFFRRNVWNSDVDAPFFKGKGANAFLASVPVFIFAFACQQNMFTIVNELRDNSHRNVVRVIACSIGLSGLIYLIFSILGYLTFGVKVAENIILGYEFSVFTTIGRVAIVIMITLTYPLQAYPCRVSLNKLISWRPGVNVDINKPETDMSKLRFYILTVFITLSTYGLSMVVSSFERVLAYVGTIGSTSLGFILPGLYYFRLADREDIIHNGLQSKDSVDGFESAKTMHKTKKARILKGGAIALMVYGIIVLVICLVTNIIHSVQSLSR